MLRQYLNILEVSPNSGILEIKRAFRKKAKKFHPDLNNS
jgi:curved DNA-binding protein CbpA